MSAFSDIKRAMRPAQMEDWELRGLREAIDRTLNFSRQKKASPTIQVPGVTKAGKCYPLLTLDVRGGRIFRFEVDHDPDLSSPAFDAYVEKRAEWEGEGSSRA